MRKHYDLTKPPKFILNLVSKFRKWELIFYKKKKVIKEKTRRDRIYCVKFYIKIEDELNPKEIDCEFDMMVPAKAAFFAKIKARKVVREKINLHFSDCELVNDEEFEQYEKSREEYNIQNKLR